MNSTTCGFSWRLLDLDSSHHHLKTWSPPRESTHCNKIHTCLTVVRGTNYSWQCVPRPQLSGLVQARGYFYGKVSLLSFQVTRPERRGRWKCSPLQVLTCSWESFLGAPFPHNPPGAHLWIPLASGQRPLQAPAAWEPLVHAVDWGRWSPWGLLQAWHWASR